MGRVTRTRTADRELLAVVRRIAGDSLSSALNWLEDVERVFKLLANHPEVGESCELPRHGPLRRHVVGNYVIYYRPFASGIHILHILHGARDIHPHT